MIRKTVHYRGRVQGVGFRYTDRRIAARYDVAGYVRNVPDGRVELVVEGSSGAVDTFLADVADTMRANIHDTAVDESAATGGFADFGVRR